MKILITGSQGFIGKNLSTRLKENKDYIILPFIKHQSFDVLEKLISEADIIFHLAGVNRPICSSDFKKSNVELSETISSILIKTKKKIPLVFASSIQASQKNEYGKSKLKAENYFKRLSKKNGNKIIIYRLPGVFGKWCKPNYNSVVATFCNNIAHNKPLEIKDPNLKIQLVYIDDVVKSFIKLIKMQRVKLFSYKTITPKYKISLKDLANLIIKFNSSRNLLNVEKLGKGFYKKLYATFLTYVPKNLFSYSLPVKSDKRGNFIEICKTLDSGQFAYFTTNPGYTRGLHYHHSKVEKFLVVKGIARFSFQHIITDEMFNLKITDESNKIVETIPGWIHSVTNIGKDQLIIFAWINEVFNPLDPDTYNNGS